jgi:hypothetical protein
MKPTLFVLGPQDRAYGGFVGAGRNDEKARLIMDGCLPITDLIQSDATITANSQMIVAGFHKAARVNSQERYNLFNLVGDADASRSSLHFAEQLAKQPIIGRVLNHPDRVRATGRAGLPTLLAGIPGLRLPRVVSIGANDIHGLSAAIEENHFNYPLILRIAGLHGGRAMQKIDSEDGLESFLPHLQDGRKVLLIEYVDSATEDGLYNKVRIVFVDGEYYPRHQLFSPAWMVHFSSRSDYMAGNPEVCNREKEFLEHFYRRLSPLNHEALLAMNDRIRLDVWGLDCCFLDNGEMLVFEANACMKILGATAAANSSFDYLDPVRSRVTEAIRQLILEA